MQLFDLLFIALFLTAAGTLIYGVWLAAHGRWSAVRRILIRLLAGSAVYMAIVIVTSLVLPRRVLKQGDPECNDDFCISLQQVRQTPQGAQVTYSIDLRLFSRALRVPQRENNLAVYLTDSRGQRYDWDPLQGDAPLNVLLEPGEAAVVSRSFSVPGAASDVGVVITHEGGFPIGWFIIGYDTWFRKPLLVRLR